MKRNLKSSELLPKDQTRGELEQQEAAKKIRSNQQMIEMIQGNEQSTEGGILDDIWDWIKSIFDDEKSPVPETPSPEITPRKNDLEKVEEDIEEVKKNAPQDFAIRATSIKVGDSGAIIGPKGPHKIQDGPGTDATQIGTIADGKPIDVIGTSKLYIQIKYRDGDESKKGWVLKSLFSPQPDLNRKKTASGETLQDDYLYTLFKGDQSPQGNLSGDDVEQGALADCFFIAAMQAVGSANPSFLEEAITYDAAKGTYKVRFYEDAGYDRRTRKRKMKPHYETVDGYIPSNTGSPAYADTTVPSHWGPLVEKAFAQWKGGYDALGRGGNSAKAMTSLTGVKSSYNSTSDFKTDEIVAFFKKCQKDKKAVICGSQNSMQGTTQTPFKATTEPVKDSTTGDPVRNRGPYEAKLTLANDKQKPKPKSVVIKDSKANVARADDSHADMMDKKSDLKGADVDSGEIDYKEKQLNLTYVKGKGPESATDLEVSFRYQGLIFPEKKVFAWHAYVFKSVTEDGLIQLHNPWGSWHPKPLTASEFKTYFSNMNDNQVPQAESMDESVTPTTPDAPKNAPTVQ